MFTKIHFDALRNSEFLQFFKEIIACCKRFDLVALLIESRVEAMTLETINLEKVYNKGGGSEVTDILDALDNRRDEAVTGIKKTSDGLTHSFETAKKAAARQVLESMLKHPSGIARLNHKAETTEIDSLILEWKNSVEVTAALATLGFTSWVEELKTANTLYSSTQQDRIVDKLATEGDSFSELRTGSLVVYDTLCKGIAAHFELDKNPEHLKLIHAINLIIDEYNLILNKRNGEEDDDTDDGTGSE